MLGMCGDTLCANLKGKEEATMAEAAGLESETADKTPEAPDAGPDTGADVQQEGDYQGEF